MRNVINRALNLLLYLALCFMAGTGVVMWLRLPPRQGRRHGAGPPTVLGLDRHDWGEWHFYCGAAFLLLILMHLVMNWTWLRKIAAGKGKAWRLWGGLALGAGIVLFFVFVPVR